MFERLKYTIRQVGLLAAVMRGFFQPNLSKKVRKIVAVQLHGNKEFRTHQYPILVRVVRWAIDNPFSALVALICPYLVVFLSQYSGFAENFEAEARSNEHVRDFWTVNLGVFAVQAALISVVFPLVIAFVGLLNQGRASFASRLTIYIDSSAALFVGISSLLLCASIAMQLPFGDQFVEVSRAMTLLNIVWFSVNVGSLGYFLLRTIAFLHPTRRSPIIKSYVANEIWPQELTLAVTSHQWTNVSALGHLPVGDEVEPISENAQARVWYTGIWREGEISVTRCLPRTMKVIDVRLGALRPVVDAWLMEVRKREEENVHDLVFPIEPGRRYTGNQVLARTTLPLGLVSRTAVKLSFRFSTVKSEDGRISATNQILGEMIADLIALIDERRASDFAEQLRDVEEFHVFLYRLAQSNDVDVNYAKLEGGRGMLSRPINQQWSAAYRDIMRRVIAQLADEPEFIRPLAYTPYRIYERTSGEVAPSALRPIIQLGEDLSHRMIDWAVEEYQSEATSSIGDHRRFSLVRHGDAYASAWREQVAGWESLLRAISRTKNPNGNDAQLWQDLKLKSQNILVHLSSTTRLVARAAWLGDTLATNWTCDLMLHWRKQVADGSIRHRNYGQVRVEGLTPQVLQRNWEQVDEIQLAPNGETFSPSLLFDEILHNAWRDHVSVLASVCIHWAIQSLVDSAATHAARMLLQGEKYDEGDSSLRPQSAISCVEFLISSLRIVGSGSHFTEGSFARQIDHLLEDLGRWGDTPRVSMRIYSHDGGLSFSMLPSSQALALLAITPNPASISGPLRRLLTQGDDEALSRKRDFLTSLATAVEELDQEQQFDLLAALTPQDNELSFNARRDHALRLLTQSLDILNGYRDQAILDAVIDNDRIAEVASAAASKVSSKSEFPHNLFNEIVTTDDDLEKCTINFGGLNKGEFSNPQMAQIPLNEQKFWREAVSDQVSDIVWLDIVKKICSEEFTSQISNIECQNSSAFWQVVRDGSAQIKADGDDPLLVIDNKSFPEFLFDWQWPTGDGSARKPEDLTITNEVGKESAYEFTMNNTPVYRARIETGVAYLLPSRLFRRLRFHDYGEGSLVFANFNIDEEKPWLGTMQVSFEREIELTVETACYRIFFGGREAR